MPAIWQRNIVDSEGDIVPNAVITVRAEIAGLPLADLYEDRDGLIEKENPFTTGLDGFAQFFTRGGAYRITAVNGAFSAQWDYVAIGTSAETDAGAIESPTPPTWLFDPGTTTADPGDEQFRLNNADPSLATLVIMSTTSYGGGVPSSFIDSWGTMGDSGGRGFLTIYDPVRPTTVWRKYLVTGSIGVDAEYRTATLFYLDGQGDFTEGLQYNLEFNAKGISGGITGPGGATDGHGVVFDGATGQIIRSANQYPFLKRLFFVTGTTTLTSADGGSAIFNFANNVFVELPAASNALAFSFYTLSGTMTVNAPSSGGVLIWPDGSTSSSITLQSNDRMIIVCDGSNWIVLSSNFRLPISGVTDLQTNLNSLDDKIAGAVLATGAITSSTATLDIVLTAYIAQGFKNFELFVRNYIPVTDATAMYLRTSTNGGSTFDAGAGNYRWAEHFFNSSSAGAHGLVPTATDTEIELGGSISNAAGETWHSNIKMFELTNALYNKLFTAYSVKNQSDATAATAISQTVGSRLATTDVDAIRLLPSSGNISSLEWTLYGWK